MIVPKGPHLWRMLTYVGSPLLLLLAWDVAVVVAYVVLGVTGAGFSNIPLTIYGSVIGIIVGFRNNSAYSRWWEARILWGSIVNQSRNLGRQVCSTLADPRNAAFDRARLVELERRIIYYQIAFTYALKQHLRALPYTGEEFQGILDKAELDEIRRTSNPPLTLQLRISSLLGEARDHGVIDALEWQAMDETLKELGNAQGGAERIKNTPLPKQYDYFPMLFVRVYCLLLPCAMVGELRWLTPIGSTVVGFMFLALEKIGRDIENPFENTIFDIPMTAICRTIEINLREMLGETELPPPIQPVRGVLW